MKKLLALIGFSVLLLIPVGIQDAYAVGGTISDKASCEAFGGVWDSPPDKCTISSTLTINSGEIFTVSSNVLFFLNRILLDIKDGGTVNFFGNSEFSSDTAARVAGTLNNSGEMFLGEIATIVILPTGVVNNDCSGTITGETVSSEFQTNQGKIVFDDGTLASTCFSVMVGGFLIEIDTIPVLVAALGTDPVITVLVALSMAGVAGQAAWFIHRRKRKIKIE